MSEMIKIENKDGKEKYIYYPYGIGNGTPRPSNAYDGDTQKVFDGQYGGTLSRGTLTVGDRVYEYVMWGEDDQLPYRLRNKVGDCMVTAESQQFNIMACYGQGPRFFDRETGRETSDPAFSMFAMVNDFKRMWLEMAVDMKYFYFTVVVFVLSRDGQRIVHVHHKEAQNCRFSPDGRYIFYGNFEWGSGNTAYEIIDWLDIEHPAEDFLQRTGRLPNRDGITNQTEQRKFGFVCRFPTVGFQYYPRPTYISVFRDRWYDIYSLIGEGKRSKIKNATYPRYQIEIQEEYWDRICDRENIMDMLERKRRIEREKRDIEDFVCGIENGGKTWITGSFVEPGSGKEISMVKVTNLEQSKKEGGDWADDVQEASNILCFAFGVHPNLIGATPGKSAMNNSGSDKRELFTLKQALEVSTRDMMLPPLKLMLLYNGWSGTIDVEVPIIQLTTLDKGSDAKTVKTGTDEPSYTLQP